MSTLPQNPYEGLSENQNYEGLSENRREQIEKIARALKDGLVGFEIPSRFRDVPVGFGKASHYHDANVYFGIDEFKKITIDDFKKLGMQDNIDWERKLQSQQPFLDNQHSYIDQSIRLERYAGKINLLMDIINWKLSAEQSIIIIHPKNPGKEVDITWMLTGDDSLQDKETIKQLMSNITVPQSLTPKEDDFIRKGREMEDKAIEMIGDYELKGLKELLDEKRKKEQKRVEEIKRSQHHSKNWKR